MRKVTLLFVDVRVFSSFEDLEALSFLGLLVCQIHILKYNLQLHSYKLKLKKEKRIASKENRYSFWL